MASWPITASTKPFLSSIGLPLPIFITVFTLPSPHLEFTLCVSLLISLLIQECLSGRLWKTIPFKMMTYSSPLLPPTFPILLSLITIYHLLVLPPLAFGTWICHAQCFAWIAVSSVSAHLNMYKTHSDCSAHVLSEWMWRRRRCRAHAYT